MSVSVPRVVGGVGPAWPGLGACGGDLHTHGTVWGLLLRGSAASFAWYSGCRGGRATAPRPRPQRPSRPKTWDEKFWEDWEPPVYVRNHYVWVASAVVAMWLAFWSTQLRGPPL